MNFPLTTIYSVSILSAGVAPVVSSGLEASAAGGGGGWGLGLFKTGLMAISKD